MSMTRFHAFELWMVSGSPHKTCNEHGVHSGTNTCSPRDSTMPILTAATPRMPGKMQHSFCMKLLNWITQACTAVKQFFTSTLTIMRLDNTSGQVETCLSLTKTHPNISLTIQHQATLHPAKQRCIVLQCLGFAVRTWISLLKITCHSSRRNNKKQNPKKPQFRNSRFPRVSSCKFLVSNRGKPWYAISARGPVNTTSNKMRKTWSQVISWKRLTNWYDAVTNRYE